MFEEYSDRSRRIVFLSRKIAGQRGGTAIEVEDLAEALVIEDQGNFAKAFLQDSQPGVRFVGMVPKHNLYSQRRLRRRFIADSRRCCCLMESLWRAQ